MRMSDWSSDVCSSDLSLQPRLLRVLDDGKTRRLGSSREVAFDVRVLAATNVRPADAVRDGRLREDLWYRLNVFELNLPPLRARGADIPLLVRHFIHVFNEKLDTTVQGVGGPTLARLEGGHKEEE